MKQPTLNSNEVKTATEEPSRIGDENFGDEHVYDDIRELDHSLPNWWVNLFYLTMIFSGLYFIYYGLGFGPTLTEEYHREVRQQELLALSKPAAVSSSASEEDLRALLKDPQRIQAGKVIFQARCVSCHGAEGQGGIGPNLTDDYWIHGGKMTEIAKVIQDGVSDKGMPPWGPLLKPDEIQSVTAFVKSLRGTNPPNPKAPQGDLVKE